MRDLPGSAALLALARGVLIEKLLPLLPEERRIDLRLIANGMAVAEREAAAGDNPVEDILARLRILYDGSEEDGADETSLRRFAGDLRRGVFGGTEPRDRGARAILWRITILKLRESNPRFLAANGLV